MTIDWLLCFSLLVRYASEYFGFLSTLRPPFTTPLSLSLAFPLVSRVFEFRHVRQPLFQYSICVYLLFWSLEIYSVMCRRDKQSVDDIIINLIMIGRENGKKCETIFVIFALRRTIQIKYKTPRVVIRRLFASIVCLLTSICI